jgi:hypothetical protein
LDLETQIFTVSWRKFIEHPVVLDASVTMVFLMDENPVLEKVTVGWSVVRVQF